jgi:cytochrome c-type biogenesis protein CcmH/NrfG
VSGSGQTYSQEQRRKPVARALAVAFVACMSMATAGCAHLFDSPEQAAPKQPIPKPAVTKAAPVSAEQRAEAKALHATALNQMGRGAFGPATSNLTRATRLDPTNEQIRRDLARANRVRSAVGAGEMPSRSAASD